MKQQLSMKFIGIPILLSGLILSGCNNSDSQHNPAGDDNHSGSNRAITSQLSTSQSYEDIADAAVWEHPTDATKNLLIGTLEGDGLAVFDSQGEQLWRDDSREILGADIRYNISDGLGHSVDLLAVALPEEEAFAFYAINDDVTNPLTDLGTLDISTLDIGLEPAGVCLYKNTTTDELTISGFSEQGEVIQYKLRYDGSGMISTVNDSMGTPLPVRRFTVGGELSACITDDETGTMFIAEQDLGVWAYGADAENVKARQLVDSITPLGHLEEIEGLDLVYMADGKGYLMIADEGAGFLLYQRQSDYAFVTRIEVENFDEIKVLATSSDALWLGNTELDDPVYEKFPIADLTHYLSAKSVRFLDLLSPRDLEIQDVHLIAAKGETTPVDDDGDAADDPAFWLHPTDVSKSMIIATNKQGGLMAYDLQGNLLQFLEGGEPNNIDLRTEVRDWDNTTFSLAATSNRELNTIALYQIVEATDTQSPIQPLNAVGNNVHAEAAQLISGVDEVYGLCMYQAVDGTPYVFVNGKNGQIEQWRLTTSETGIEGAVVRTLTVATQPEGCVADDTDGKLYVGEEDVGIWVFDADESADTSATQFAKVDGKHLVADVEGLTIFDNGAEKFLIASSQGNNTYVLYDLLNNGDYIGTFAIIGDDSAGIDGASDTDGIDVISANLGADYPEGMFIAQDWYNIDKRYQLENQNFKLASWKDIIETVID
ncbi:3-phytase [Hahella sp. CCB-MM4]|uniref:phytase n=1 Tax=Hahella sp. (strain CCB-MM4) TaxID=1926491 RepID=UPI000BCBB2A5|nr:phytase [Hahella sp. CCB-MM4]OZG72423.1 3-phytase [Hahella sp. CCB-MM4]